jgi:hypothetical protein
MKTFIKLSFLLFLSTIILSCNPDEEMVNPPANSTTPTMTFNCYLDGVNYTFTGDYPQGIGGGGTSAGTLNAGIFSLVLNQPIAGGYQPFSITISMAMNAPQTGSFVFNSLSPSTNSLIVVKNINANSVLDPNNIVASYIYGGDVTMNITEFGTTSYTTNPQNPGRIKGNFSGVVQEPNGTEHTISGTFDSIRII